MSSFDHVRDLPTIAESLVRLSKEQYFEEIRRVYRSLRIAGYEHTDSLYRCDGAFPVDVLDALAMETTYESSLLPLPSGQGRLWRTAENDLIESEWYFTRETAYRLLSQYASTGEEVVALGCPTVAEVSFALGKRTVLVDSSPWLDFGATTLRHLRGDVSTTVPTPPTGSRTIFVDPPWHLAEYLEWSDPISRWARVGDRVVLALPQRLSLRSARAIRDFTINYFSRLGSIDIKEIGVSYETPPFEAAMLRASGLSDSSWRTGALLIVSVTRVMQGVSTSVSKVGFDWKAFNVSGTAIRLISTHNSGTHFTLKSPATVLRGPSRTLLQDQGINVISSSGIGIAVTDGMSLLEGALSYISEGYTIDAAVERISVEVPDKVRLAAALHCLIPPTGGYSHES